MSDAQHLEPLPQVTQPGADDIGNAPADAGIDLVEDHRRHCPVDDGQRLQRQHHARQLAAGHDPRERPEVLAPIERCEELRVVDPALARVGDDWFAGTYGAGVQLFHCPHDMRTAAALRANLDDPSVSSRSFDHQPAFADVV